MDEATFARLPAFAAVAAAISAVVAALGAINGSELGAN
jgi:hypothetical protein